MVNRKNQGEVSGKAPISQRDLEILLGLEGLIRQRWILYDRLARSVLRRLLGGAPVEDGPHVPQVRRGRSATLLLDGIPALPPMTRTIGKARRARRRLAQERD